MDKFDSIEEQLITNRTLLSNHTDHIGKVKKEMTTFVRWTKFD